MYVVLGATGHVRSAVADALLGDGATVTVITRDEKKAADWRCRGPQAAIVDIGDADALRDVLRNARRAYLLNPPAPTTGDTDAEEHRTGGSIVRALRDSGLEQVVAQSTYGAQAGDRIGDLSTLYDF